MVQSIVAKTMAILFDYFCAFKIEMAYSKDWYVEWFDSAYYHLLYQHRDEEEARLFIRNLFGQLGLLPHIKVLDLACGKGRHAQQIHRLGYDVLGLDLSKSNITHAKQFEKEGLSFTQGDMRELPFQAQFDAVLNLFTSFGYFDDDAQDQKTIHSIANALKTEGLLVVDYLNIHPVVQFLPEEKVEAREHLEFNIQKEVIGKFIRKRIEFYDKGHHYQYEEFVKCISLDRFEEMLKKADFQLIHTFGDYELNAFEVNSSPRLIMVAKKINQ